MRKSPDINRYRVRSGEYGSEDSAGRNGAFMIPFRTAESFVVKLRVIASDADGWDESDLGPLRWEHVSVSLPARCPSWLEMDYIKRIFWGDDETVMQLHVPRKDHINHHPFCLHLWKPIGFEIPIPPSITVGPAGSAAR